MPNITPNSFPLENSMNWIISNLGNAWYFVAGYGFSILTGLLINGLTNTLRGGEGGRGWKTMIQGSVEQAMYTGSYFLGKPEFIALWLGIKTAAQWQAWTRYKKENFFDEMLAPYLVGNALSIVIAVAGARMITWAQRQNVLAWIVPASILSGIILIRLWVWMASTEKAKWLNTELLPRKGKKE